MIIEAASPEELAKLQRPSAHVAQELPPAAAAATDAVSALVELPGTATAKPPPPQRGPQQEGQQEEQQQTEKASFGARINQQKPALEATITALGQQRWSGACGHPATPKPPRVPEAPVAVTSTPGLGEQIEEVASTIASLIVDSTPEKAGAAAGASAEAETPRKAKRLPWVDRLDGSGRRVHQQAATPPAEGKAPPTPSRKRSAREALAVSEALAPDEDQRPLLTPAPGQLTVIPDAALVTLSDSGSDDDSDSDAGD